MALPHWLARVNLAFGNALLRPFTGILPGFGVLEHVGRRSGVRRQTPLTVFRHGERYVIALTYGPDVQWVKNVLAAGRCRVRNRGRWVTLTSPRRFSDPQRREVHFLVRPVLALLRVSEFLELQLA
ncbi:MAG TPA: nitroreductase family deazaflavin-dependent oxidoreductase [Candidatus Dormibacteraeota bacterium]|nr:nitroreductase family deazaflavin-dependent oxidoreductase [Candidatus Dormibacteraeota bacterium]